MLHPLFLSLHLFPNMLIKRRLCVFSTSYLSLSLSPILSPSISNPVSARCLHAILNLFIDLIGRVGNLDGNKPSWFIRYSHLPVRRVIISLSTLRPPSRRQLAVFGTSLYAPSPAAWRCLYSFSVSRKKLQHSILIETRRRGYAL